MNSVDIERHVEAAFSDYIDGKKEVNFHEAVRRAIKRATTEEREALCAKMMEVPTRTASGELYVSRSNLLTVLGRSSP